LVCVRGENKKKKKKKCEKKIKSRKKTKILAKKAHREGNKKVIRCNHPLSFINECIKTQFCSLEKNEINFAFWFKNASFFFFFLFSFFQNIN
jgi:hypothetical protein